MMAGHGLVFGGTSDSLLVCDLLQRHSVPFTLSVASEAGKAAAEAYRAHIRMGRLDQSAMECLFESEGYGWIIDASHPYARELHQNVAQAAATVGLTVYRLDRSSQINDVTHPLVTRVKDVASACQQLQQMGNKVLLTTGSKDLGEFVAALPDHHLIARILPTSGVMAQCEALGLKLDQIIAMKGPFTAAFNQALYQTLAVDVVVTKESGSAGGYLEKVQPCIDLGIPCVVIERPERYRDAHIITMTSIEELEHQVCSLCKKD